MARTYDEVAREINLSVEQAERFCAYMRFRWDQVEQSTCEAGMAGRIAERFKVGKEYDDTDPFGRTILRVIDSLRETKVKA
jgi:Mn-dependent DtxR family transcriptional regulator